MRLRRIVDEHYDFLWRSLRHLGVDASAVEDAAQQVLLVTARRLGDVTPGAERSFLFGTALRIASEVRRAQRRSPIHAASPDLDAVMCQTPSPEELLGERRAQLVLDAILDAMPIEQRAVFCLHEIEEMTMATIAETLELAPGTVASRLRRARATFRQMVARAQARAEVG